MIRRNPPPPPTTTVPVEVEAKKPAPQPPATMKRREQRTTAGLCKPGAVIRRGNGTDAVVLHVNPCRVHILTDEGSKKVEIDGKPSFTAANRKTLDISPDAEVTVIGFDQAKLERYEARF